MSWRLEKLAENRARYGHRSFCEGCQRVRRKVKVFRIIPPSAAPELIREPTNLVALCEVCGAAKTRDDRERWQGCRKRRRQAAAGGGSEAEVEPM